MEELPETAENAQVRKLLARILPSCDELSDWLASFFPQTRQQLSRGMNRTEVETLLLQREGGPRNGNRPILEALRIWLEQRSGL
jgi:hypothetical protein